MIIESMTIDEIVAEVQEDLKDITRKSDFKQPKVDKIILKSKMFPVYVHSEFISKRKNKWLVLWEGRTEQHVGKNSLKTFICICEKANGRYAIMPNFFKQRFTCLIFIPHFFARYAKRFNVNRTGIDLIRRFFQQNPSFAYSYKIQSDNKNKHRIHVYGKSKEGSALGIKLNYKDDLVLFKTFISEEMYKGKQIEDFAEKEEIRKEYDAVITDTNK